jgi:hypothetical protein
MAQQYSLQLVVREERNNSMRGVHVSCKLLVGIDPKEGVLNRQKASQVAVCLDCNSQCRHAPQCQRCRGHRACPHLRALVFRTRRNEF